jgi:hypothetical protein
VLEGAGLFCAWGFGHHGFDRIFIETAEFNLDRFASLADVATVEGRLRNYEWWKGRYWDQFILSLTPSQFEGRFGTMLRRRSQPLSGVDATTNEFAALVEELWPLDSLGFIEVLDLLEELAGTPVDAVWLDGLDELDARSWTVAALAEVQARQQRGSVPSPPGSPSGPGASSELDAPTSILTVPVGQ